ncbi:MAG: peptide deformylase [Patescibacteria group bacterium]
MLKIVSIPHPSLYKKAKQVQTVDRRIQKLVKEMEKTLDTQKNPEGVGLSAPQVAIEQALFIIKDPDSKRRYTFINPVIEQQVDYMDFEHDDENLEGCLSIPEIWAPVQRYKRVQVRYLDVAGNEQLDWFEGFLAVVVQHEFDHLQGVLFTKRALEQGHTVYKEKNGKLYEIEYV